MTKLRKFIVVAALSAALAVIPMFSIADNLTGAARTKQQFETIMANPWKHMVRGTTAALAEPKTAADLAVFTHNYYKALVDQGFSKDEALALVGRISFPIGGGRPESSGPER